MMMNSRIVIAVFTLAAAIPLTVGCYPQSDSGKEKGGKVAPHTHPEKGPHGGPVVILGEDEYHMEVTFDRAKKEARVYIYEEGFEQPLPVKAKSQLILTLTHESPPVSIELKADPQKGDKEGTASQFFATHEKLDRKDRFSGTLGGRIDGTAYRALKFVEK
jgi:hypothetical protein